MKTIVSEDTSHVKTGFTLIELLVVIAIIALLAAILFPVFARARENARKSSCMNSMKQIGVGLMQYVQDFDETYVYQSADALVASGSTTAAIGNPAGRTFADFLHPYIKNEQVWKCASSSRVGSSPPRISYHMNGCMNGTALADLQAVSKIGMFRDPGTSTSWSQCYLRPVPVSYQHTAPFTANNCNGVAAGTATGWRTDVSGANGPHFDGYNVCFADGHAKWLAKTDYNLAPPNAKIVFSPDGLK